MYDQAQSHFGLSVALSLKPDPNRLSFLRPLRARGRRVGCGEYRAESPHIVRCISLLGAANTGHNEAPDQGGLKMEMARFIKWSNATPGCDPVIELFAAGHCRVGENPGSCAGQGGLLESPCGRVVP